MRANRIDSYAEGLINCGASLGNEMGEEERLIGEKLEGISTWKNSKDY